MKTIYLLIIGLISSVTMFAQGTTIKCERARKIEEKNIKLAKDIFRKESIDERINGNIYVCGLSTMSDEKFNALCDRFEYNSNYEKLKRNNPNLSSFVTYAKDLAGGTNIFVVNLNYKTAFTDFPKDAQKRLQVIDNTIELYKNLQKALDREMQYNTGEILDNGTNLVIKHIPAIIPKDVEISGFPNLAKDITNLVGKEIIKSTKDEVVINIAKKSPPIDNWLADDMNDCFKKLKYVAVLAPPLRVITEHPYYKIFVSLPEAGKIIGHAATYVNIYFRKNEYQKIIEELENEKRYIYRNGQTGPIIKSMD